MSLGRLWVYGMSHDHARRFVTGVLYGEVITYVCVCVGGGMCFLVCFGLLYFTGGWKFSIRCVGHMVW